MSLINRVDHIVGMRKDMSEDYWLNVCTVLCKEFGWTQHDLMNQKIPFVMNSLMCLKKMKEEESKLMKGGKRGRYTKKR